MNTSEQASHNGDLMHAVEDGVLTRDDASQFGDVLIGTAEGRQTGALEDVVASGLIITTVAQFAFFRWKKSI